MFIRKSQNLTGALFMSIAMAGYVTNDAFMKLVGSDLRSSAALIIAAMIARGTSRIYGLEHLDRGYENFESKLERLGIRIKREIDKEIQDKEGLKLRLNQKKIPRFEAA